ncbi:MAG: glycoside hydrolase family 88 protein, partial [Chloroflexota bacterium]
WGAIDGPAHDRGRTNVDLMMNLALLFWCTEHTGDPRYARIAEYHARTSRFVLVRPDDSTVHVADFDPETGAFLKHATHQGLSEASCWSRGHAWAVYGFTEAYQYTGIPAFLTVARRLSHYAIREAPPDLIPYWDYDSPDIPNTFRDTSAAAVLAAALLELATCESDENEQKRWYDYAEALLLSLWQNYSTRGSTMPAILSQGSRSVPHGMANHALIYGDYYFVQALTKLLRPDLAERTFSPPVSPQVM